MSPNVDLAPVRGDERVVVGAIVGVHGVRGAVKIKSFCEPGDAIFRYRPWLITPLRLLGDANPGAPSKPLQCTAVHVGESGGVLLARIAEIEDRDQALRWLKAEISVLRSALPALPIDQYYWNDLIGLRVLGTDGFDFGVVDSMLETGANDVLVVRGTRERLIPYVPQQVVQSVDLAAGEMRVAWDPDF